jgi:glutamate mutase epsilon subunit
MEIRFDFGLAAEKLEFNMDTQILDQKIKELAELEAKISDLNTIKDALRKEVFAIIEASNLEQYKSEKATVSYVERKSIKIKDEEQLLKDLEAQQIVKYYQVIPEHKELNKKFQEDIKQGVFQHDLVEVTTSKNLAIRFKEETK